MKPDNDAMDDRVMTPEFQLRFEAELTELTNDAYNAGIRDARAHAVNPQHSLVYKRKSQSTGGSTPGTRATSPFDLANRARELQEADRKLSNEAAVKEAYREAGLPI